MKTLLDKNNPILRQKAELVNSTDFGAPWLKELAYEMLDIMKDKCAVGVAAPQIGISKRLIVFGTTYTKNRKIDEPISNTILVNPTLKILSEDIQTDYEGCLNCGELRAVVPRALKIEYSGYDLDGNFISKNASGLEARILQHEIDHLDGLLFLDRIEDKSSLTTVAELQKQV